MKNDFIKKRLENKNDIPKNKPNNAPKKDTKKVATIILTILMLFWTFGSIFGLIGGIKSVSAEERSTTTFNSSTYYLPFNYADSNYGESFTWNFSFPFSCEFSLFGTNSFSFIPRSDSLGFSQYAYYFTFGTYYNVEYDFQAYIGNSPFNPEFIEPFDFKCIIQVDSSFSLDIIGIRFGYEDKTIYNDTYYMNVIQFLSSSGGVFKLYFQATNYNAFQSQYNTYLFSNVTYYFADSSADDYQQGYIDGFINGKDYGIDIGYDEGFNKGFDEGLKDESRYTFFHLISAVIDAPINAFSGLLNFELLGFNMLNFFMALFTLCLIIVVIKKFI